MTQHFPSGSCAPETTPSTADPAVDEQEIIGDRLQRLWEAAIRGESAQGHRRGHKPSF